MFLRTLCPMSLPPSMYFTLPFLSGTTLYYQLVLSMQQLTKPTFYSPSTYPIFRYLLSLLQPVLTGVKLRMSDSIRQFSHLAEAIGCGVVTLPDAKGLFRSNMHFRSAISGLFLDNFSLILSCQLITVA